jgi:RNA polymerase sigma-70 factor (ECF subfamily)
MSTSEPASDDDLMPRIAGGDREAFATLYRRRRLDVYRFARHMTGSAARADDVTQEVFVVVIDAAGRYVPGRSGVVPWLLGIARNHVRRSALWDRRRVSLPDPDEVPELSVEIDPLINLAHERELAALRHALKRLPLRYREMVVLCDLQELSYADAAAIAGCALGTVRSRLHRGRAMLAARLRLRPGPDGRPLTKPTSARAASVGRVIRTVL